MDSKKIAAIGGIVAAIIAISFFTLTFELEQPSDMVPHTIVTNENLGPPRAFANTLYLLI